MEELAAARLNMVESQIRPSDVTDRRIIAVMSEIPREVFVPTSLRSLAYADRDIEVSHGEGDFSSRHMMAPRVFAKLLQLAAICQDDLILDVGSASGYSTAILSKLAEFVFGLESNPDLATLSEKALADLDIDNVVIERGELEKGYPGKELFDVILLNGSVPFVPETLSNQLKEGGRLIAVISDSVFGKAHIIQRINGELSVRSIFDAGIKPLPGFARKPAFTF